MNGWFSKKKKRENKKIHCKTCTCIILPKNCYWKYNTWIWILKKSPCSGYVHALLSDILDV